MSNTATVETLTAEVRVLMVGNRQVTLSVARQLDEVFMEEITPFGRISLNDGFDWVIGADEHGALSRARRWEFMCPELWQAAKAARSRLPLIVLAGLK